MPKQPERIPPAEAASEALERLVSRRRIQIEPGDVVLAQEPIPGLRPASVPGWRYRLFVHPVAQTEGRVFTTFQNAASAGEQLATERRARLMYVEQGVPSILNDYRR